MPEALALAAAADVALIDMHGAWASHAWPAALDGALLDALKQAARLQGQHMCRLAFDHVASVAATLAPMAAPHLPAAAASDLSLLLCARALFLMRVSDMAAAALPVVG
ncbi:MAG: hypothetical protein ACK41Y_16870, partial [Paracoccus hibiscisoli]|uniref:hypothetical protein n=1 Tax=Paracoccus hibiscisoli TaxID=2023261 RepID=UPI00391DEAA1